MMVEVCTSWFPVCRPCLDANGRPHPSAQLAAAKLLPRALCRDHFPPNKSISLSKPRMTVVASLGLHGQTLVWPFLILALIDWSPELSALKKRSQKFLADSWVPFPWESIHSPGKLSSSGQAHRIAKTSMALHLQSFSLKTGASPQAVPKPRGRHKIPAPMPGVLRGPCPLAAWLTW